MSIKQRVKKYVGAVIYSGIGEELTKIKRDNMELLWARVWDDTCRDIDWIKDMPGISPGRWAVGYNYLYVMTRILNELNPRCILDLGLGISSTLITSYVSHSSKKSSEKEFEHIVVEQDKGWIDVYTCNHKLHDITKIYQRECRKIDYNGYPTYAYVDFESVVKGHRFDVISIDGPWGGDRFSRRDIVPYIPQILNDDFVIIIDDSERIGEKDTIDEIIKVLNEKGISNYSSTYFGSTDCSVIVSEKYKYICTM